MVETTFPTLYKVTSKGAIQQWTVSAISNRGIATMRKVIGQLDGKLRPADKEIKGKNIGRSNETTPYEQAKKEAEACWKKKTEANYVEHIPNIEDAPTFVLPNLATKFVERMKSIIWFAYGDIKLNGVRCLLRKVSDTEIDYRSRTGKSYNATLSHLTPYLLEMMEIDEIFDGEIYVHGWSFQKIIRRVKKMRPDTNQLEYWVYDMPVKDIPFSERKEKLEDRFFGERESNKWPIQLVQSVRLDSEADVYKYHDMFVKQGFEGIIIRNTDGMYGFGKRTFDLQKYKHFDDNEYKIIGGKEAEGTDKGTVIFECEVLVGDGTFNVRPRGSLKHRRQMLKDLNKLIGKDLTVRHFGYSEDGIPTFPVGVAVRDYE